MDALVSLAVWTGAVVWALYLYDFLLSLAGFWPLPRPPKSPTNARFAIVVCAHNEARVIRETVESLLRQEYPREAISVFVVADNCSDETARIAREAGATVLERFDETHRTKGYALQWGIERVVERGPFDALCVFDADNMVPSTFFATMNDYLAAGHVAIQAYLDTKNPDDSWVTRSIALAYFVTNRFWMRPRARLGLAATLGGTGFCLAWPIAARERWDPASLADDLELTMKLVLEGIPVSYCRHTRTFDEKPITLRQALRQRARWMQGHHDVALRWTPRMLKAALLRPSFRCFDAALHLLQPLRLLLAAFSLATLALAWLLAPAHPALARAADLSPLAWSLLLAFFVAYPLLVAATEGAALFALRSMLPAMLFSFTWIPAALLGLLRVRRRVWVHTGHGLGPTKATASPRAAPPS